MQQDAMICKTGDTDMGVKFGHEYGLLDTAGPWNLDTRKRLEHVCLVDFTRAYTQNKAIEQKI